MIRGHNLLAGMFIAVLTIVCAGCAGGDAAWKQTLKAELPRLGHRNWIVIADSAYPLQKADGIETISTGTHQLDAVRAVLDELGKAKHVQAIVHLDSELQFVPEPAAPGVGRYRAELDALLAGRRVERAPHEQLIAKLDNSAKLFHVLILKTDLTIPYSSVFLELDCGYWGPEQEKRLRDIMSQSR